MKNTIIDLITEENGTETLEMLIVTAVAAGLVFVILYMKSKFVDTAKNTAAGL